MVYVYKPPPSYFEDTTSPTIFIYPISTAPLSNFINAQVHVWRHLQFLYNDAIYFNICNSPAGPASYHLNLVNLYPFTIPFAGLQNLAVGCDVR